MPRPHFTPEKDLVPILKEARWVSGRVWKGAPCPSPPPGYDPRNVQPVANRYTYRAHKPVNGFQ